MLHNNPFTNYIQGHCQLGKFLSAVIYKQACFAKIILSYYVVNKRVRWPSRLGLRRWVCPWSIRRLYACGSRGVVRASNPSYPTPTHLSHGWKFKFLKLFFNLNGIRPTPAITDIPWTTLKLISESTLCIYMYIITDEVKQMWRILFSIYWL